MPGAPARFVLAAEPSRRDALKGMVSGALASVAISAEALSKGKTRGKDKHRGRKGAERKPGRSNHERASGEACTPENRLCDCQASNQRHPRRGGRHRRRSRAWQRCRPCTRAVTSTSPRIRIPGSGGAPAGRPQPSAPIPRSVAPEFATPRPSCARTTATPRPRRHRPGHKRFSPATGRTLIGVRPLPSVAAARACAVRSTLIQDSRHSGNICQLVSTSQYNPAIHCHHGWVAGVL
jgi:hypothetical protein